MVFWRNRYSYLEKREAYRLYSELGNAIIQTYEKGFFQWKINTSN